MKPLVIREEITKIDSNSLRIYLNEISRYELITPDEEFEISKKAIMGDESSIDKLIKANLRFVVSVAKQYQISNIDLMDLISAGNIGLYKAVSKYDPTMGNKFISYAVYHIRASIITFLNKNSSNIYIPGRRKDNIRNIKKTMNVLENTLERKPTLSEIRNELNGVYTEDSLEDILKIDNIKSFSYDDKIGNDNDGGTYLDRLSSDSSADFLTELSDIKINIKHLLNELRMNERIVLSHYFGIDGFDELTISGIASKMGISEVRVGKIKQKSLRRLFHRIKRLNILDKV